MSEDDLDMVIALNNIEASKREAMSDESINKFLCETVEGRKWNTHPCGDSWANNPDYLHSGDDYIRLMQAAMKEAWWENFVWTVPATWLDTLEIFVTPSRGARALAEFLGWKEDWE